MDNEKRNEKKVSTFQKIVIVSIFAISTALSLMLKKYYIYHITAKNLGSIEYFTFINFVTVFAVLLVLFAVYYAVERKRVAVIGTIGERPKVELPYKRVWVYILIAGVTLYVYELFTSYASEFPSAIYYPLARGLAVVCTFLLDVIVFREKVTVKKSIAASIFLSR